MMRKSIHLLGLAAALSGLIACGSPSQTQDEASVEQPKASAPIEQTVEYDRKDLLRDIEEYVDANCSGKCRPEIRVSLPEHAMPMGISNENIFKVFTYEFEGKTKMGINTGGAGDYSLDISDAHADGWGPGDVLRDDFPLGDDEHKYFFDNPEDREQGKELYDLVMDSIYKARASGVEFE